MTVRPIRIPVDIPVVLSSVLESGEAVLSDLTEYGALVEGASLPKGTQVQIEYQGQTVYAFVVWTETDRFGVRFPFSLCEGSLHDRLEQARMEHEIRQSGVSGPSMLAGGRRAFSGFGRRGIN